jgi:hypothetical protein
MDFILGPLYYAGMLGTSDLHLEVNLRLSVFKVLRLIWWRPVRQEHNVFRCIESMTSS